MLLGQLESVEVREIIGEKWRQGEMSEDKMSEDKMSEGYQVIEIEKLWPLIAKSAHDQFSAAILSWIVKQLRVREKNGEAGLHFDLICVQYASRYLAIGAKYPLGDEVDRENLILEAVSEIIRTTTLEEFVGHLLTHDSWEKFVTDLLKD